MKPRKRADVLAHSQPSKLHSAAPRPELAKPLIKAARWYLADGGTIEEALSLVVTAARQEWLDARIAFTQPARFRIDGAEFEWPGDQPNK
jgi:hypothetical protein